MSSLRVSANGRCLVHPDGSPFFYLGDTCWELFHRTDTEEADLYLENRARLKFTVIQAVVLAEQDGLRVDTVLPVKCDRGGSWGQRVGHA